MILRMYYSNFSLFEIQIVLFEYYSNIRIFGVLLVNK